MQSVNRKEKPIHKKRFHKIIHTYTHTHMAKMQIILSYSFFLNVIQSDTAPNASFIFYLVI